MLAPSERAEVVIVGGGLAGLATAWALTERGVTDLVLLERGPALAGHASGRNAAMCRALAEDDAWTELTAAGARLLRQPPPSLADRSLVDDRGALLFARAPGAREAMLARAERHGVRCSRLEEQMPGASPSALRGARQGLWFPDDGVVDLAALIGGLAEAARRAGARIACGVDVLEARPAGDDVDVVTSGGAVRAAVVVNAAGAWAGELAVRAGAVDPGYQPRRRHVFALAHAQPDAPITWIVDEDDESYTRPAGDETWISACDSEPTAPGDVSVRPTAVAEVRARFGSQFADVPFARTWACQRTFAPGGVPVIARDPERPWLCAVVGLGGHGVTASLEVGRRAAAVVVDALAVRARATS